MNNILTASDPVIAEAIRNEVLRQVYTLEMIASENFVSSAVLEAQGSVLTNKYAEGYPGRRYYGGCEFVDVVERTAQERARTLFGAQHANVQPHSGTQANISTYLAFMKPGDVLMGMSLAQGGHLTHGHKVNFSGMYYNIVPYGLNRETELIDYEQMEQLAREHRPRIILAGASAYPRDIDFARFAAVAKEVGALFMVDMAHPAGLIAAGLHSTPVPHADIVTSTTHKTLRGPRGGLILCREEHRKLIDKMVFPGNQGGPLMHVIAAKAVAFGEALTPAFKQYATQVIANARELAAVLCAGGLRLISGGTDTHLMLVDVTGIGLTGTQAEEWLEAAGITVNKNAIPWDPHPPMVAGGIRIGTPALTSRGMKEAEMRSIGGWILEVLQAKGDQVVRDRTRARIRELCREFPLYPELLEG